MSRGRCRRHRGEEPCTCVMGNLYRFVEPLILYSLQVKGTSHGYDLIDGLNRMSLTDSVIETGGLYRNLRRLEKEGVLESTWDSQGSGPARRMYRITSEGRKRLEEWLVVLNGLSESMSSFVKEARAYMDEHSG